VLAHHFLLLALCFFTILLSSTIQTLARRHHLPFDHATNRFSCFLVFLLRLRQKNRNKKMKRKKEKKKKEKG
jgi:hypothetical protein